MTKYLVVKLKKKMILQSVKCVEKYWLKRYILLDGRFSKFNTMLLDTFFNRFNAMTPKVCKHRSLCFFSRSLRSVSKHNFWLGRHALNNFFKLGRLTGYRKC